MDLVGATYWTVNSMLHMVHEISSVLLRAEAKNRDIIYGHFRPFVMRDFFFEVANGVFFLLSS